MSSMASQITSLTIVYSTVYSQIKENIKALRHWLLCGEFTDDRQSVNKSSAPQDRSNTQLLSSTVHAWVVIEWPLQFLH